MALQVCCCLNTLEKRLLSQGFFFFGNIGLFVDVICLFSHLKGFVLLEHVLDLCWDGCGSKVVLLAQFSQIIGLFSQGSFPTGWQRLIGFPKLQIIFHKRATKYRSLLRKMTYKDKESYESSPPCGRYGSLYRK